jgi:predicted AlkP superfamily phosphohydrolase/phosphomutase
MIGLDGFDISLAERFAEEGSLPNFARLRDRSARYALDHGRDKYSGLAWEHVSSGRSPSDGGRWSAITFDRDNYAVRQEATSARPFLADLSARAVVFDVPYFDLSQAPGVRGIISWGAHDPGVAASCRPEHIREELDRKFGFYPATQWIYGFCWPSVDKTRAASDALVRAVDVRTQVARWLLTERLPDWDLALVVVSEGHSAIEPLWHGVDPSHPLYTMESAAAAATGLRNVYSAIDRLIGDLQDACPDATIILCAMHGMGPNDADVATMVLLPELLYRSAFGTPYLRPVAWPRATREGIPLLGADDSWDGLMFQAVPRQPPPSRPSDRLFRWLSRIVRRIAPGPYFGVADAFDIQWMPAARYSPFWPHMPAFALPAYYDGRVRINLRGREARGIVPTVMYQRACEQTTELLLGCNNLLTGERAIAEVYQPKQDPFDVGASEADLYVIWQSAPSGLWTPGLGTIGPFPYRRTGGHTGSHGFLYVAGDDIAMGDAGVASSFDVVPTVIDMLGEIRPSGVSGRSLAAKNRSGSA